MQARISQDTARTAGEFLRTMGTTGALPRSEAAAAAAILRQAAKNQRQEGRPQTAGSLLTAGKVAQRLNCSSKTVLRMADAGQLTRRYLRPGNAKSLRFSEAEIEALCGVGTEGGETSK